MKFYFQLFLVLIFSGCGEEETYQSLNTYRFDANSSENKLMEYNNSSELDDLIKIKNNVPNKNGLITEYYEVGTRKSEINYENGVKNGLSRTWFSDGVLKEEKGYSDDRFHGQFRALWNTGDLRISGFYNNGKQHGEWILYDKEGNPMPSIYYENGVEVTRILPSLRD